MSDSSQPPRCPCGFWGSKQTKGMCSKCFKDGGEQSSSTSVTVASKISQECIASAIQCLPEPDVPKGESSSKTEEEKTLAEQGAIKESIATTTRSSGNSAENNVKSDADTQRIVQDKVEDTKGVLDNKISQKISKEGDNKIEDPSPVGATSGTKSQMCESETEADNMPQAKQKSPKRCHQCNCKLELAQRELGKCRCEYVFCLMHRHPEAHSCEFDHKESGRAEAREKIVKPTRHVGTSVKRLDSDI